MKITVDPPVSGAPASPPPSQQVIPPNTPVVVTDSKGRKITLRKPGVLAEFRFVEALGVTAENRVYMSMALPLLCVADVDGEPVNQFFKKSEIEALIQRLDDHGMAAVMKGVEEHFNSKSDMEADVAAIKK